MFKTLPKRWLLGGLALCFSVFAAAKGLYLTQQEFIQQSFSSSAPVAQTVWLKGEVKTSLQEIMQRKTVGLRQRYWSYEGRSAWVFNEIGKELPITIGVVVEDGQILDIRVLEYRESRGAEVRHGFFTQQFSGAVLDKKLGLDRKIDGITGATMSVRSMKRVASAALFLHSIINS